MSTTKYPEYEKLKLVKDRSQEIGDFLQWLIHEKNIHLSTPHEHVECERACGYRNGDLVAINMRTVALLAEYFEIDEEKLEAEKVAMIAELRGAGSGS